MQLIIKIYKNLIFLICSKKYFSDRLFISIQNSHYHSKTLIYKYLKNNIIIIIKKIHNIGIIMAITFFKNNQAFIFLKSFRLNHNTF